MLLTKIGEKMKKPNIECPASQLVDSDYGKRAREALAGSAPEGDPLTATPELSAMLELLADDGHSIDGALDELNRLKGTLSLHLTVHRQLVTQVASVQSSHAAILCGRGRR